MATAVLVESPLMLQYFLVCLPDFPAISSRVDLDRDHAIVQPRVHATSGLDKAAALSLAEVRGGTL